MLSLTNSGLHPDFYVTLTNKEPVDLSFRTRCTQYCIAVKHLSVIGVEPYDNKVLFLCLNIPLTPPTYVSNGGMMFAIMSMHAHERNFYIDRSTASSDLYVVDFATESSRLYPSICNERGRNVDKVDISMVLSFTEIVT